MSASDQIAAIQSRLKEDEDEYDGGMVDQSVRDRRYLLKLVRQQAAKLEAVAAVASEAEDSPTQQGCVGVGKIRAALDAGED